ncbi:putative phosphoglycerate mutase pmu1 [Saxophila tyrrhenica]|uniref:Phosphoglycerate mutase pmu1 n=1 Tax=Saxophila tyrrhenica TaxID=1690608 RepID=A0AAV9NXQ2_9PEZI|nr:putative phosphoglycerate mutase pmu1 [Saxophila tyrrhenica]
MGSAPQSKHSFEYVPGFFAQGGPESDGQMDDYMKHNFGLLERKYETDGSGDEGLTQWQRYAKYVRELNGASEAGTTYKVFYVGRHGEGYHNVAESKYGTKAWDDHWSKLDGDGELYWVDAHLTSTGREQALANHDFLKRQFSEQKMPLPENYYSSPLYRCLQTAQLTYANISLPSEKPFSPLIMEMAREVMGEHTCDRRSSRSVIHDAFPDFPIEMGFSEEDELWQADHRETHAEHDLRTRKLLDDVFEADGEAFVSLTSHSGSIASLLRVSGHREFRVPTGGMMPVFVKATKRTN